MSWVAVAAGGASALSSGFKLISGARQAKKAKRELANLKAPVYTRPQEAVEASKIAQSQFLNKGLPMQGLMENKVSGTTARAINDINNTASSSGDALDAITKVYSGEQEQLKNIGMTAAQQDLADSNAYRQQLGVDAGYSDKEWDINTYQPYKQKAAEISSRIAAGNQNVNSGLDGLGQVATSALMAYGDFGKKPNMGQLMGTPDITQKAETITGANITPTMPSTPVVGASKMIFDPATGGFKFGF